MPSIISAVNIRYESQLNPKKYNIKTNTAENITSPTLSVALNYIMS